MKSTRRLSACLVLAIALAGCAPSPSFLQPASQIASHVAGLFNLLMILSVAVLVFVEAGFAWSLLRDRKRDGDDSLAPQISGSKRVEMVWTVIPVLLVIVLFVLMIQTMGAVAAPAAAAGDLNLRVVGHRWWWEFDYPDLGIITSIAPAHLEGLGSLAGVAREKGALYGKVQAHDRPVAQIQQRIQVVLAKVIVTGFDLGMDTPGGYGQYVRVPSAWARRMSSPPQRPRAGKGHWDGGSEGSVA